MLSASLCTLLSLDDRQQRWRCDDCKHIFDPDHRDIGNERAANFRGRLDSKSRSARKLRKFYKYPQYRMLSFRSDLTSAAQLLLACSLKKGCLRRTIEGNLERKPTLSCEGKSGCSSRFQQPEFKMRTQSDLDCSYKS
jgi:hypothetical protein